MNLFLNLGKFSSNICAIDENYNEFTYQDLFKLSDFITNKIKTRSIAFLICNNSYEFLASYVGLIRKKIVFFLISCSVKENDLIKLIKLYKPEYIIKPNNLNYNYSFLKFQNINDKYHILKTNFKAYKVQKELALLLSTSGSTGSPKFVKISYSNLSDNTKKISEFLKISENDRTITTLQPNYIYGLSIINSHLFSGALIVLSQHSLVEKKFWDLFKKTKVTSFGGVPYTYSLLKKLRFKKMFLPSLKYITQAGGRLNSELLNEFYLLCKKKKIKLIIMYGQTEATGRISYLDWSYLNKKKGSIGKPIEGGNFFLYDKQKNLVSKKLNYGELVYTGKNVMLGYALNKKDLNKDNYKKRLFTGDIAKKDNDGFYFIEGRNNRFIKIIGHRFNLDEIESELKKNKFDCICSGHEDLLKIFSENQISYKKLSDFLMIKFSIRKLNFLIFNNFKFPRNENGKILYDKLNVDIK